MRTSAKDVRRKLRYEFWKQRRKSDISNQGGLVLGRHRERRKRLRFRVMGRPFNIYSARGRARPSKLATKGKAESHALRVAAHFDNLRNPVLRRFVNGVEQILPRAFSLMLADTGLSENTSNWGAGSS